MLPARPGEILQMDRRGGDLHARLADRDAGIHRFERGERLEVAPQQLRQPMEQHAALASRELLPDRVP